MINISCRTNIDCAKHLAWPTMLPARPVVGDLIRSLSSTSHKCIELQVVQCTWIFEDVSWRRETYLEVYLGLPPHRYENIQAFEKFVKGS